MKKSYLVIVTLLLFIIDRITKILALKFLTDGLFCCNQIAGLKLLLNNGVAFGILIPKILSITLASLIILILINVLLKTKTNLFPLLIIIAGAFSNILDRLNYDAVIDFITIKYMPIFNLADIYIVIGLIMLIYGLKSPNKDTIAHNT
ncbi:MAG: signal peptidase II [Candidatus Komeilibacteria bacterium]